jgi:hypothetical protein
MAYARMPCERCASEVGGRVKILDGRDMAP